MVGFLHDATGAQKWWGWTTNVLGASTAFYPWGVRLSAPCPDGSELVEDTIWEVAEEIVEPGTLLGGSVDLGSGSVGV